MFHSVDKVALAMRRTIFVAAIISAPVMLISYAYALKLLFEVMPTWLWLLVCASHVIIWLGIASLFDKTQEQAQRSPDAPRH